MTRTPIAMRALVTGSRTWRDTEAIHTALDTLANSAAATGYSGLTVVHGGAKGADTTAGLWVLDRKRRGWKVHAEVHLAEWRKYGNAAGMRRNRHMVRLGADLCLAFLAECESSRCSRPRPHYTHGATDCADLAEASDIHTVRIVPRPAGGA